MKNDRLLIALLVAAGLGLFLLGSQTLLHHTVHWDWNAIRLERSAALGAGEPLYQPADRGLILNQIYGPVAVFLYLPTLLFARPTSAIVCGQLIAVLSFFLPVLWLHLRVRQSLAVGLLGFLAFATLTLDLWPLTYAAFTIHVDAPALGLGALAGGLLLGRSPPSRRALLASAACVVLAVWTKQVMATVGLLLALYLSLAWGQRAAARYGVYLLLFGATSLGLAVIFCGPITALWFHLVAVPGQQPWRWGGGLGALWTALKLCFESSALAWALAMLTAAIHFAQRRQDKAHRAWLRDNSWILFWLLALGNLPLALMGRAKVGGDANAFSYTVYFLVLGAILGLLALLRHQGPASAPWSRLARGILVAMLVLLLPWLMVLQEVDFWGQPFVVSSLPHEIAFDYARAHPGEIYFPRLIFASFLAEGRLYHSGTGLLDRILAGLAIDPQHLATQLPDRLRGIAFHENGYVTEKDLLPFSELSRPERDPALPGFVVFVRPQAESPDRPDAIPSLF